MSKREIEWAQQHDWYLTDHFGGYANGRAILGVVVIDHATLDILIFTDYDALRQWAGY